MTGIARLWVLRAEVRDTAAAGFVSVKVGQAVKCINGQARSKPEKAGIGARPLGRLLDCL